MTDRGLRGVALGAGLLIPAALARLPVAHDEAYYWTWSKALAPAYLDHPPGVAWVLAAARLLFGDGVLALRVASGLALALTLAVTVIAAREAAPRAPRAAGLAVLSLLGGLMFTVGYLPATPDPFQGAALAVAGLGLARGLRGRAGWGAIGVLALGAAVLVKHSSGLIAVGALAGALASAAGRRALRRPGVLLASVVTGAVVGLWLTVDVGADAATAFQRDKVFSGRPFRGLVGVPLALGALLLAAGPAVGGATLALLVRGGRLSPEDRLRAGGAGALLLACCVAAVYGAGEVNWPMPAAVFVAPSAVAWALETPARARRYRIVALVSAICGLVVLAHIVYPFAPLPPRKDRTLRAVGFSSVAQVVDAQMKRHGGQVVLTRRYQLASQLRFHLKDAHPVLEVGGARPSQFDRWPRPALCPGDVAVVAWGRRDLPPGLEGARLGPTVTATRARAGRAVDPIFVQPVRISRSPFCGVREDAP